MQTRLTFDEMKDSSITIEDTGIYNWKWEVYDIASFVDASISPRVLSENRTLTTSKNSSPLIYMNESTALINKGEGKNVNIANDALLRHGYTFKGWTTDPSLKNIKYTSLNPTLSVDDGYKKGEAERLVTLYAVWDVDKKFYYTLNDLSNDGTVLPGTYKKDFADSSHVSYNYYKEVTIPSEGYTVPHTKTDGSIEKVTLTSDFAIAEHPFTGYMLDEIRSWAVTEGYEIPTSTLSIPLDDENTVGYGSKNSGGDTEPLGDASHPLTFVTVPQALVIANAFTAYYNAHKESSASTLDYAYRFSDDTPIKTISDAKALVEVGGLLFTENSRGFRLPTDIEWEFVARSIQNNDDFKEINEIKSPYVGSSYPYFQKGQSFPGNKASIQYPDDYSWYSVNSERNGERTTLGFTSTSLNEDIPSGGTLMSKYKAISLIRNLSGNIKEWTTPYKSDDNEYRLRGGSFLSSSGDVYIESITSPISPNERNGEYGLRLVRSKS